MTISYEIFQLPPPSFETKQTRTTATMYAYKSLNRMEREEKTRACYQHCCLKYVMNERMTNESIRGRFGIEKHNAAKASRIIRDTLDTGLIKRNMPNSQSKKAAKYIPFWA